jgi:flagellar motor switch protein FliG
MSAELVPFEGAKPPAKPPEPDKVVGWDAAKRNAQTAQQRVLRPIEKAAIILAAIGPETASPFLKDLNEATLTRCAKAISELDRIPEELLDAIIAEFLLSIGREEEVMGGLSTARRLLAEVLDEAAIEKIMFDVEGGDSRGAWKKLNDISVSALTAFIRGEHPQTAAVILSELRPDKAAGVIERLDPEFAQLTIMRLSHVPSLDQRVSDMIEDVIARDFLNALQRTKRARRPADIIANLMNNLGSDSREKFIAHLEDQKPALAKEVLRVMFTFADIRHRVEPREVSVITKEVEEPVLMQALKSAQAAKNPSAEFILSNISKRMAERFNEDLAAMPEVPARDGEAAQQEVVRVIQELAKTGKIRLIEEEGPEVE